jgi:hypothetical protein
MFSIGPEARKRHAARTKRAPQPISSDITRDLSLETFGCYDRTTCLPVVPDQDSTGAADGFTEWEKYNCLSEKYTQSHDSCCLFHALGVELNGYGSYNLNPEGCTPELWPVDDGYYEGRLSYAQVR